MQRLQQNEREPLSKITSELEATGRLFTSASGQVANFLTIDANKGATTGRILSVYKTTALNALLKIKLAEIQNFDGTHQL